MGVDILGVIVGLCVTILLFILVIVLLLFKLIRKFQSQASLQEHQTKTVVSQVDMINFRLNRFMRQNSAHVHFDAERGEAKSMPMSQPLRNIFCKSGRNGFYGDNKDQAGKVKHSTIGDVELHEIGTTRHEDFSIDLDDDADRTSTPILDLDNSLRPFNGKQAHIASDTEMKHFLTSTVFPTMVSPVPAQGMNMFDAMGSNNKFSSQTEVKHIYTNEDSHTEASSGFQSDPEALETGERKHQSQRGGALREIEREIDRSFNRLHQRVDPKKTLLMEKYSSGDNNNNNNNNHN